VPDMLHGRVVRPPAVGATLAAVDEASMRGIPGARVVTRGSFVGVVAEREELAIRAARELRVTWNDGAGLPAVTDLYEAIRATPTTDRVLRSTGDVTAALAGAREVRRASYQTPFQMHASIGPSCAVADVKPGQVTIWSGTQGAWGLRDAIAQLLGVPREGVRVIWVEASGCYGHNGADDAAADAALLSQAVGRPVRVQWMRHDEHGWEPKGPAMVIEVRAALDPTGAVLAWDSAVRTPTHSTRPGGEGGNLLAGQLVGLRPRTGFTGGDRNAEPPYVFPNERVTVRWQATSVVRSSALRGLGAPQNTYANESFMDELAAAAQADPIEFRLRHLTDPRASAVLQAAAKLARWTPRPSPAPRAEGDGLARGRGVAYARYENRNAHVAVVTEVAVDRRTGVVRVVRVWVAHDCGLVINPDGVRNQIEGSVVQTISRALKEEVAFDRRGVTSLDWSSYPILTFSEVPEAVEIVLIDRPDQPAVGAGEPAACPVPAAVANAIFDATGARVRTMPFTAERVRKALA
jgi:nicotinate dehydrogenase subunit B